MNNVREIPNAQKKNKTKNTEEKPLQWHPAFFAEIQIELKEDSKNLYFENEHQLGTKPKEIDILIIKKNSAIPIRKNIGRIFRKYNIIEYKGPDDSLTINDFYKVLGYTYFYKADTQIDDEIKLEELTITFVSRHFPQNLFQHLKDTGKELLNIENGIWYTEHATIPIQFIITSQLSEKENFWLKHLTNDLQDKNIVNELLEHYKGHNHDIYYNSVMDIIMRANKKIFQEDEHMCDAMMEILQDRIDIIKQKSKEDGFRLGEENGFRLGEQNGLRLGEEKGLHLAKMVLRMNAEGTDHKTIAAKCMIPVETVKDILDF